MTKMTFLWQLRRCAKLETLDRVIEHQRGRVSRQWTNEFELAADHRRAEIITGRLFDWVPKAVWKQMV
ncbi:Hha/YmoA family nucleoid-associated regulatory protein [Rahnella victoriana]|uniref:Hha/YmoA family nucleoid-associated regulatory protein n=1 Tax=Rahnella victoriana TaxID=1510570 RepID=UPI001E502E9C|nr:Hha/YmoA family nucleoid-associated regulatory protein [Rahnella victoriana]UHM93621.1 transcriptional regulator [Rahnella victoriana]